jgi:hypothetical protein
MSCLRSVAVHVPRSGGRREQDDVSRSSRGLFMLCVPKPHANNVFFKSALIGRSKTLHSHYSERPPRVLLYLGNYSLLMLSFHIDIYSRASTVTYRRVLSNLEGSNYCMQVLFLLSERRRSGTDLGPRNLTIWML